MTTFKVSADLLERMVSEIDQSEDGYLFNGGVRVYLDIVHHNPGMPFEQRDELMKQFVSTKPDRQDLVLRERFRMFMDKNIFAYFKVEECEGKIEVPERKTLTLSNGHLRVNVVHNGKQTSMRVLRFFEENITFFDRNDNKVEPDFSTAYSV